MKLTKDIIPFYVGECRDNKMYNRTYSFILMSEQGWNKLEIVHNWPEIWELTPEDKLRQKDTELYMAIDPDG